LLALNLKGFSIRWLTFRRAGADIKREGAADEVYLVGAAGASLTKGTLYRKVQRFPRDFVEIAPF
jgi:hypothetical protein